MVVYDNYTNEILAEPMKNRSQQEIVQAQAYLREYLTSRGFKPLLQILDNECPNTFKTYFVKNEIKF